MEKKDYNRVYTRNPKALIALMNGSDEIVISFCTDKDQFLQIRFDSGDLDPFSLEEDGRYVVHRSKEHFVSFVIDTESCTILVDESERDKTVVIVRVSSRI